MSEGMDGIAGAALATRERASDTASPDAGPALTAVALTREAAARLAAGSTGWVHSAYARTVNLTLDGQGDAGWLSLHGPGVIPAPFGIACAAPPPAPPVGAPVRIEAGALVVGTRLRIALAGARVRDTGLPPAAPAPPLDGPVGAGLLPVALAVLTGRPAPAGPLAALAAPPLAALRVATARGDVSGCLAAAHRLLGLGPGLTPAGDDGLAGWLAGLGTAGVRGRGLVAAVGPDLLAAARERTGPLSRAFLAAAAAGVAAEPLHAFAVTPDAEHRSALLALGATSGGDLLAGYLLARHAAG
jgi:hypothetical protein